MAPTCRYEAGLAQASHVAMQPHGLPVNQPVRQPARHTVRQPAQPASSPSSHPATQPANHPHPGPSDQLAAPAGPRPGHLAAWPVGRPAGVASRKAKQSDSQSAASHPGTKLQPAGLPAGRLASQPPQPAGQTGLVGWVSWGDQATPGWRWPDRLPVVPDFGWPGALKNQKKIVFKAARF
jgi:hypothetical protein